jgi:hypothetical protein
MENKTHRSPMTRAAATYAEHAPATDPVGPRAIGRLRVPLDLHHQPWATLYRFPDGRLEWCLRLWQIDQPIRAVVSTRTLRQYARENGLRELASAIDALVERALRGGGDAVR